MRLSDPNANLLHLRREIKHAMLNDTVDLLTSLADLEGVFELLDKGLD